jgi:aryl-alcohol dehydrogenase-like predicted oxidoreductase
MDQRTLGSTGLRVSAVGLGCMGMSDFYGPADEAESIATIHAALDAGVTLIDTGDYYAAGHNDLLIGRALAGRDRDRVAISVKFGLLRAPDGSVIGIDGRSAAVKSSLAYTLRRLGTDHVDVYRLGRLDPSVPMEETIGAIGEMVQAGYVRHVGLSEAGAETVRRAHGVQPIADLQIEYSIVSRGIEDDILPACRELGIGVTAYGVLSRGLLSGHWSAEREITAGDFRATAPRFVGENLQHNLALVDGCDPSPTRRGCRWHSSRLDGCSRRATTSFRSSEPVGVTGWPRRSGRSSSSSMQETSPRSSGPCRAGQRRVQDGSRVLCRRGPATSCSVGARPMQSRIKVSSVNVREHLGTIVSVVEVRIQVPGLEAGERRERR